MTAKSRQLNNTHERGDLALRQRVALARVPPRGLDEVLQAVRPAVHLAAGHLDRAEILDDPDHRVQPVPGRRVLAPDVLPILVEMPPVTEHAHGAYSTPA